MKKANIDDRVVQNSTHSAIKRFWENFNEQCYARNPDGAQKCFKDVYDYDIDDIPDDCLLAILPDDKFFKC